MEIKLAPNPDIAEKIGEMKTHQKVVIFAAESQNLIENAKQKLKKKNADMVVANDITLKDAGFAADTNIVSIIDADGNISDYPKMQKSELAKIILKELALLLGS
jgi:phosphopantothenoylcysteine decarboxylase/phosphopantothenate--cysteine ligase